MSGGNRYQFSRCNQCRFQVKMAVNKSRTYISASQITFFFPMEASNSYYNPILYGNVSADDLFRKTFTILASFNTRSAFSKPLAILEYCLYFSKFIYILLSFVK